MLDVVMPSLLKSSLNFVSVLLVLCFGFLASSNMRHVGS